MDRPRLFIGNKNYSSWSMRPWLALRHGGVDFEEVIRPLPEQSGGGTAFNDISPTGRVPVLHLGGARIAESLAIAEWAAEAAPWLWPEDRTRRAGARAASAIMHAGFAALRNDAPMNIRRRTDAMRMTPAGLADAAAMDTLWRGWLQASGGPFLFGQWSIADAMYAPAATRFVTYAIARSDDADRYIGALTTEPHMAAWIASAAIEPWALARTDNV